MENILAKNAQVSKCICYYRMCTPGCVAAHAPCGSEDDFVELALLLCGWDQTWVLRLAWQVSLIT